MFHRRFLLTLWEEIDTQCKDEDGCPAEEVQNHVGLHPPEESDQWPQQDVADELQDTSEEHIEVNVDTESRKEEDSSGGRSNVTHVLG